MRLDVSPGDRSTISGLLGVTSDGVIQVSPGMAAPNGAPTPGGNPYYGVCPSGAVLEDGRADTRSCAGHLQIHEHRLPH